MPVNNKKEKLFTNVGNAFREATSANAPTTRKAAGELWDEIFNDECKNLSISANERNPIKQDGMFKILKNDQINKVVPDITPPPLPEMLPPVEDEDEEEVVNFYVDFSGEEYSKSPLPSLDSTEKQKHLKNIQKFAKQYIIEIKNRLGEIKNKKEKTFWKNEIKALEKLNKDLNNPKSSISEKMLSFKGLKNDNAIINEIKKGIEASPNDVDLNLDPETLKNAVLEHFILTPEGKPGDAHPEKIYKRSDNPAPVPKVGAALLLSRIAGTPKKTPRPDKHLKRSVQEDLEKMRDIYIKEIKDLKLTTADEKEDRKAALKALDKLDLKSNEALTAYKSPDITFEDSISQFILSRIDVDSIMNPEKKSFLAEKASRKFSEAFAPEAHKKIIQKTNAYAEKLQKDLITLNKSISKHTENAQGAKLEKQNAEIERQETIKASINVLKSLSMGLTNNDPSTMKRKVPGLYSLRNLILEEGKKENLTLINLLEETLKVSDPYYSEIKRLDKYITDLKKDIEKNPPKANEDFSKKSNREAKLAIAEMVRKSVITPPKGIIGDKEGAADNVLISALENARTQNKANTKTLIGKGKLDGIIGDILTKIQPEQKKKSKPK